MSELKVYHCNEWHNEYTEFYMKSEADKVIAEKDAKILALDAEVSKQKHHAKLFFDERNYAEAQLNHANYKRCLAMAEICEERYNYLTCLENWQLTDKEYQQVIGDYWDRWHHRWLELAEKFKEAK